MTCSDFCIDANTCGCSAGGLLGDDEETCEGSNSLLTPLQKCNPINFHFQLLKHFDV